MQPLLCRVMIDRDDELAVLGDALARAASGHGSVVFVLGEAGVGKSRLLLEALTTAEAAGMTILRGRATERSAPPPYRPLAEAVQPALLDASVADDVVDPFRRALRPLLDERGQGAGEAGELAVAEALGRVLGSMGGTRGCLLALEDLHWSDPETLAVVEYLADHLRDQPVAVAVAVRSGEASAAERLARVLRDRRAATVISLQRLGAEAADRMLGACLGTSTVPAEVRRFVHDHADGLPLFVEELLAGLADSGALVPSDNGWKLAGALAPVVPFTYAEAIRRRLDALPPGDRDVLLAAAVLGRRFRWTVLPAVAGSEPALVLDALRRASDSLILEPDDEPDAFRFRHALTRDAVLADLLPPEQAAIASRALAALSTSDGEEDGPDGPDLVAELAERAGDRPRAVAALVAVARTALRRGALTTAKAALERAARLARSEAELSVLVEETSAHAAALAGDVDDAIRRAALVLAALPSSEESAERRARLHLTLARAASVAGRWSDASRHVDDALSLTRTSGSALRAEGEALAAHVALAHGRDGDARALAGSAVRSAATHHAPATACEALEVLGRVARVSDLGEAERLFREALAVAERHDLALWRARALHELGTIDLYRGIRSDRFEAARAAAVEAGAVSTIALCDLHLATAGYAQWDPHRGIAAGRRCVDLSRRLGLDTLGMGLVHLATCHAVVGEVDEMEAVLAEAQAFVADEVDVAAGIPGRARMGLAMARGDVVGARAALDEAMDVLRRREPDRHFPFRGLWALLCSVAHQGDGGAAARTEAAAGSAGGTVFNEYCLVFADAVALGRAGHGGRAAALAEPHVVDQDDVVAWGWWAAVALVAMASAALRDGWGDGERWARLGLARFECDGLDELASWSRSVLRAAGRPVPRRGRGGGVPSSDLRALGVTDREAQVLELVAGGATNKEIAGRLHLSPRTVERHVSNLLTKTGATDRRALSRVPRGSGSVGGRGA